MLLSCIFYTFIFKIQGEFGLPDAAGLWVMGGCSRFWQPSDEVEYETRVEGS